MNRDFVAGKNCPICGGSGSDARVVDGYQIRVCCGIQLSWQWDSVEEYYAMYASATAYSIDEQIRENSTPMPDRHYEFVRAAELRLNMFTAHYGISRRKLVDVGAGTGAFVECAQDQYGWDACGIEPCGSMVELGRTRRLVMHEGGWSNVCGKYDVISMHDVWEHLVSPMSCLDHLASCLADDGVLVIEIPEWDGPDQRQSQWDWRHIRPRQHICLPSRASAESMFEDAGFQVDAFYRPLRGAIGKCGWYLKKPK